MEINDDAFGKFPVINTHNLTLREIVIGDIEEIFTILSNIDLLKYFGKLPFKDISEAREKIIQTADAFTNKEGIRWGITTSDSDKLIGTAGIWRIDRLHKRGEIGYELLPDHWGKGIMKKALSAIIDFGFKKMNFHSLEANTDPRNIASNKLLESLGFCKEGHIKESFFFNGQFFDTAIYSKLNPLR